MVYLTCDKQDIFNICIVWFARMNKLWKQRTSDTVRLPANTLTCLFILNWWFALNLRNGYVQKFRQQKGWRKQNVGKDSWGFVLSAAVNGIVLPPSGGGGKRRISVTSSVHKKFPVGFSMPKSCLLKLWNLFCNFCLGNSNPLIQCSIFEVMWHWLHGIMCTVSASSDISTIATVKVQIVLTYLLKTFNKQNKCNRLKNIKLDIYVNRKCQLTSFCWEDNSFIYSYNTNY